MEVLTVAFLVPMIIFLVVVAPIWTIMHYTSKRRRQNELSESQYEDLQILIKEAHDMEERIQTLEAILDSTSPNWRERSHSS